MTNLQQGLLDARESTKAERQFSLKPLQHNHEACLYCSSIMARVAAALITLAGLFAVVFASTEFSDDVSAGLRIRVV